MSDAVDTPAILKIAFGDGYTQRAPVVVGNTKRKQTLTWTNTPQPQAARILFFLERMGGVYPFMWIPNGENTPRWFIASSLKY